MQKPTFQESVEDIISVDPRYSREGYDFLREALEFTQKGRRKSRASQSSHVNASELLDGFRDYTLEQFGPMAITVLDYWGIHSTEDIGQMVFNLVNTDVFGSTENDRIEDFDSYFTFDEAFAEPFRPTLAPPVLTAPKPKRKRKVSPKAG